MTVFTHRKLIVIAGNKDWSYQMLDKVLKGIAYIFIDGNHSITSILGNEYKHVVYDCNHSFDPDLFAAVSGAIMGGGQLILLTPSLAEWPQKNEILHKRILVEGYSLSDIEGNFIKRLIKYFESSDAVTILEQSNSFNNTVFINESIEKTQQILKLTIEQHDALTALGSVISGHAKRPLVITADRGRGKSTVMGLAAASALKQGRKKIIVTATNKAAVSTLLNQAARELGVSVTRGTVVCLQGLIQFIPADELIRHRIEADLVLVDEAAAIALPMLEKLLLQYSRIAFATTLHGYEGSGRGFKLRFEQTLDKLKPQWKSIRLKQPVRWREGDKLEQFTFDALLLNADDDDNESFSEFDIKALEIKDITKVQLMKNESLLRQVFSLLLNAHYQTSPFDLLNILDGPNINLSVVFYRDIPVAASWIATEGLLSSDLIQSIALGQRRPRGHLLPQTLVAQAGYIEMGSRKFERIVRIAVHPLLQGLGIGSTLLNYLIDMARARDCDFIGSSFAATPELLKFWNRAEFKAVRLGIKRDASSGAHSVLLLKSLNSGAVKSLENIHKRFQRQLPTLLTEPLADLEPLLVSALLKYAAFDKPLSVADKSDLNSFINGNRQYADCLYVLEKVSLKLLSAGQLSEQDAAILVNKILKRESWQNVAGMTELTGKKQIVIRLREIVALARV